MSAADFIPYRPPRLHPEESRLRAEAFRDDMRQRRSIRSFSPDPVPRSLVEEAIVAASAAPSGAHMQPWTFVLVGDPAVKHEIRIAAEKEERKNYEGGRLPPQWRAALEPLGTDWQKPFLDIAPWLVVVFAQRYGVDDDGSRRHHYYVKESVGIACGLFIAAIHHMGLATLTHTPSPMGFLATILGRPENERPFILFPVGYPAADCTVPNLERKPLDEVLVRVLQQ
ncbi:MAG: nitroreductase family protein [Acidimicrobiia bacterium]